MKRTFEFNKDQPQMNFEAVKAILSENNSDVDLECYKSIGIYEAFFVMVHIQYLVSILDAEYNAHTAWVSKLKEPFKTMAKFRRNHEVVKNIKCYVLSLHEYFQNIDVDDLIKLSDNSTDAIGFQRIVDKIKKSFPDFMQHVL